MKNKLKSYISILFCFILLFKNAYANEPFIFDVSEIEILEEGNQINGYKGGTATSKDGSTITAENFFYNKLTNILETSGNVKYIDKIKNITITTDKAIYFKDQEKIFTIGNSKAVNNNNTITASNLNYNKNKNIFEAKKNVVVNDFEKDATIYADEITYFKNEEKFFTNGNSKAINDNNTITASILEYDKINNIFEAKKNAVANDFEKDATIYADEITYFKNEEKIFTKGRTKVLIEDKYRFNSENVSYYRNLGDLISQKRSSVEDDSGNIYKLESFKYNINKELLKGKVVNVFAKVDENKTDQYFFSEGFFDFKNQSHIAKETKIKIHKNVFENEMLKLEVDPELYGYNDPRIYGSSSSSDQNKTIVNNGIFTSCKLNDNCPPWSIKAEKITHDKIKKDMIYKNAILKIYDVPVLYFPKFFHPDPTVKRRSGFLQPQLNNSETVGSSIQIPYFKTLGYEMDLTFKPTLFDTKSDNNKYILQNEFRKKNKDSSIIADFALTKSYRSPFDNKKKDINHFFFHYDKNLQLPIFETVTIDAKIERVSNDTYLKVFRQNLFDTPILPSNLSTLTTEVNLNLDHEDYYFTSGIQAFENLGVKHSDRYQFVFPYYNFSKNIFTDKISGSFSFNSSGSNILQNTNNLRTSITNDIGYSSIDYFSDSGFKSGIDLYFKNLNSKGRNDKTYTSSPQIDAMNIIDLNTSFPLFKIDDLNIETLTPKISFRVNPGNNMNDFSNSGSNINADNAFNINRLGISDSYEAGKSLTLGIDYKLDPIEASSDPDAKDKYLEFKLATVMRDQVEADIPTSSTINRKSSDIFGSFDNNLFENINFGYDFSLDNNLKTINSNTINTEIEINNFITTFNFIEQRNEIGTTHAISSSLEYTIDKNTSLKFDTRRNKEINLTEYYNLSYEYKNDCLTAALKFNKTFYSDNDLAPTEDLFFTLTLIPLTTYEKDVYKRRDGIGGLKGWFR
jgi:LPS-assembly protein